MLPRALSKRDIHCSQFSEWLMGNTTDWLINSENNHQLQPQSTSVWDHTASASQRIFTAIAVGTRGLKRCQLCQSDNWNLATSLDIIWLNVWSAVFLILCEFVLCCQSYWLFFCFFMWSVLSLFIYVFQRNPAAQVFRPASLHLSIALRWQKRIDLKCVSAGHRGLFNSLTWWTESLMCAKI